MSKLNIIARKPRDLGRDGKVFNEYVLIDRGERHLHGRFVSATANSISLLGCEWFWGNYFDDINSALEHFNSRTSNVGVTNVIPLQAFSETFDAREH